MARPRAQTADQRCRRINSRSMQKRSSEIQRHMLDVLLDVRGDLEGRAAHPATGHWATPWPLAGGSDTNREACETQQLPADDVSKPSSPRLVAELQQRPLGTALRNGRNGVICSERRHLVTNFVASTSPRRFFSGTLYPDEACYDAQAQHYWRTQQADVTDEPLQEDLPERVVHRHHHHHYHHHYFPDQQAEPEKQQASVDVVADAEECAAIGSGDNHSGNEHRHLHDHHHTGELDVPQRARLLRKSNTRHRSAQSQQERRLPRLN